jgi:TonB family protein
MRSDFRILKLKAKLALLLAVIFPSRIAADQVAQNFRDALLKHTVVVRGFHVGSELRFDQNGRLISSVKTGFGAADARIYITDVQFKPDRLTITGQRTFPVYDQTSNQFRLTLTDQKVGIDIALPADKNIDTAVPELLKSVFFTTAELDNKCTAEEQSAFQKRLPPYPPPGDAKENLPDAKSEAELPGICFPTGEKAYLVGRGVKPPKALKTPDPNYSEQARKQRIEGTVILVMIVDSQGQPTTFYVAKPVGTGLEAEAIRAVEKWHFAPATFHGNPVPAAMNVEVYFHFR